MELNVNISRWFNTEDLIPVGFYAYPCVVTDTIFRLQPINGTKIPPAIKQVFQDIKDESLKTLNIIDDNKVAIKCYVKNFPHDVYLGYKDGSLTLGFGIKSLSEGGLVCYSLGENVKVVSELKKQNQENVSVNTSPLRLHELCDISNSSRITQSVLNIFNSKLNNSDLREVRTWFRLVKDWGVLKSKNKIGRI